MDETFGTNSQNLVLLAFGDGGVVKHEVEDPHMRFLPHTFVFCKAEDGESCKVGLEVVVKTL